MGPAQVPSIPMIKSSSAARAQLNPRLGTCSRTMPSAFILVCTLCVHSLCALPYMVGSFALSVCTSLYGRLVCTLCVHLGILTGHTRAASDARVSNHARRQSLAPASTHYPLITPSSHPH